MISSQAKTTRRMTVRYLTAVIAVAALTLTNYVALREELRAAEQTAQFLHLAGQQRTLLRHTALLAHELVAADPADRSRLRTILRDSAKNLESVHFRLVPPPVQSRPRPAAGPAGQTDAALRAVYYDAPSLLDTEVRNYIVHLEALADAPESELTANNPHFRYVRDVALSDQVMQALDAVVDASLAQSAHESTRLEWTAYWSLISTYVVLALSVVLVFQPMVRRVRAEMGALQELNDTLEHRVAERTALAEERAGKLAASEESLRRQAEVLRVSETLYRSLVDNLPVCVIRKDRDGRFLFVNELVCQLLNRPLEEIVGKTDYDFYPQHLARKYRADDDDVMATGRVFATVEGHVTADGTVLHVEVRKTPVRDASGEIVGTQTIFWDVTERINAERERQRMQEQLLQSERLAAIGQMVAGVAHESRNALQEIEACTQLLEWQFNGDEESRRLLHDIRQAEDRLLRLFEDLRGYAAPRHLHRQRAALDDIVQRAWTSVVHTCNGRNVRLEQEDPKTSLTCDVDPFQIEQVFRNILENSVAACRDPVCVRVKYAEVAHRGRPAVQICFHDNGPGIPDEDAPRIFEPFFTTKTQGTGLGMAITRRIVEAHGGEISVGRPAEPGAEFLVTLPREAEPSPPPREMTATGPALSSRGV